MKRLSIFFGAILLIVAARADEQLRDVQQSLKEKGFFYGEADGKRGTETDAAIRRMQGVQYKPQRRGARYRR